MMNKSKVFKRLGISDVQVISVIKIENLLLINLIEHKVLVYDLKRYSFVKSIAYSLSNFGFSFSNPFNNYVQQGGQY